MKVTEERVKEMHAAGWGIGTIQRRLNQQGHDVTLHEINKILNVDTPKYIDKPKPKMFYYTVNEGAFTFRTTETLKNRYYLICDLLNKGIDRKEIAKKLGIKRHNVDGIIGRQIIKHEK